MASSDSIQLHLHNAAVPLHVFWDIRCVLANLPLLLEQTGREERTGRHKQIEREGYTRTGAEAVNSGALEIGCISTKPGRFFMIE